MEQPLFPADMPDGLDEQTRAFLAKKTGVMVCIPNLGSRVHNALTFWLIGLGYRTIDPECPYFFKLYMPNDLTPVEYARNECVREFLKDPFYKKLFFIDSDTIPPANALDLLGYDDGMVSGLCHIWQGGDQDKRGFYVPPRMKINAFDFRPETDDFISKIPPPDGRVFYCDAAGAACLVIRRDLLEAMPEPWFRTIRDPYGAGLRGEDLDFCRRAGLMGIKVLYVPTVQFGHIKQVDMAEVIKYGIAARRSIMNELKKVEADKLIETVKNLPDIRFGGEEPIEPIQEHDEIPKSLEVIQGGRR